MSFHFHQFNSSHLSFSPTVTSLQFLRMRVTGIVVMLMAMGASLCISPVSTAATETKVLNTNAQDVLDLIEKALSSLAPHKPTSDSTEKDEVAEIQTPPSKWPWIDHLISQYDQSASGSVNASEDAVAVILQHYAVDEELRHVVIREFVLSNDFQNFTHQEYAGLKKDLLQWFVTRMEYRTAVLGGITCTNVVSFLKGFTSLLPKPGSEVSFKEFYKDETVLWNLLNNYGDNDCFKNILIKHFILSEPFRERVQVHFSNSKAFSESVTGAFVNSRYFLKSLVSEYVESEQLLDKLQYQRQQSKEFQNYLLKTFIIDKSFRNVAFRLLSTNEWNTTDLELNEVLLRQATLSEQFRRAVFLESDSSASFKESILEAFSSVPQFNEALVKSFASSSVFKKEVLSSKKMLSDAMELFEKSELFSSAVLKTKTLRYKM